MKWLLAVLSLTCFIPMMRCGKYRVEAQEELNVARAVADIEGVHLLQEEIRQLDRSFWWWMLAAWAFIVLAAV